MHTANFYIFKMSNLKSVQPTSKKNLYKNEVCTEIKMFKSEALKHF